MGQADYQNGNMAVYRNEFDSKFITKYLPKKDKQKKIGKSNKEETDEIEIIADRIERSARVLFPLFYIVFNIFYWKTYLSVGNMENRGSQDN